MNWTSMSDIALIAELGKRLRAYRLHARYTQQDLATRAGLSLFTVAQLEKGKASSLRSIVAILRVLRLLENMEALLPELPLSPLAQLQLQGKTTKRIYTTRTPSTKQR